MMPVGDVLNQRILGNSHQSDFSPLYVFSLPFILSSSFFFHLLCYSHFLSLFLIYFLFTSDAQQLSLLAFCCYVRFNHVPKKRDNY